MKGFNRMPFSIFANLQPSHIFGSLPNTCDHNYITYIRMFANTHCQFGLRTERVMTNKNLLVEIAHGVFNKIWGKLQILGENSEQAAGQIQDGITEGSNMVPAARRFGSQFSGGNKVAMGS